MPELITDPVRIPVPGGKVIEEHVGAATTGDRGVSVARMSAPAGWSEPAQTPDFDEVTVVLAGEVLVEHDGGTTRVGPGQSVVTRAGERIRYSCGSQGAEYLAICTPAFTPDTAHRDEDPRT
ncbi:cupin domain-containing protein [Arsenicicoccus dermatophilus]|uniref:cupin domain-containing protein n=1 Tax=Arsenicicoccus dermatophilus TaxID=1076331 RepID=UPI003916D71C